MARHSGYLLIADISGYTAYLTSTELDHATPVIASLLEVLVARLGDPLHLWRMEGDAVLAYTTDQDFPDGNTFLTICEDLYNAFAARRQDIHANTTCTCRACAQVPDLDLKVLVHHGAFDEIQIGPMRDISGPDAILVHLLAKTDVREKTGVGSYALLSDAAFQAMGQPKGMVPYQESFEHFGEVQMQVYDLAAAWDRLRAKRQRVHVSEADGIFTERVLVEASPRQVWQLVMSPRARADWMGMLSVTVSDDLDRPGPGARYHCVHTDAEFHSWVLDWEPFQYVTNRYLCVFDPTLSHTETYEITPTESGSELRYTAARMVHPDHPDELHPELDEKIVALYAPVFKSGFERLALMARGDLPVPS